MELFVIIGKSASDLFMVVYNNIPNILICGNFRIDQLFFKWYGRFYRNMLTYFTRIFVQNAVSVELLNSIGIPAHIAFDTRFDRVEAGRVQFKKNEFIDGFIGNHMMIVFGSTWTEDDVIISKAIDHLDKQFPNLKYKPNRLLRKVNWHVGF